MRSSQTISSHGSVSISSRHSAVTLMNGPAAAVVDITTVTVPATESQCGESDDDKKHKPKTAYYSISCRRFRKISLYLSILCVALIILVWTDTTQSTVYQKVVSHLGVPDRFSASDSDSLSVSESDTSSTWSWSSAWLWSNSDATTKDKCIEHPELCIPIIMSPVVLLDRTSKAVPTGIHLRDGGAASGTCSADFIFPAVDAARLSNPDIDIFQMLNIERLCDSDMHKIEATRTTLAGFDVGWENEETRKLLERFDAICPLTRANFFSVFGMKRWVYVQALMMARSIESAFFVEGDVLLATSVAQMYNTHHMKGFAASVSHVSSHSSFVSVEFLRALNVRTVEIMESAGKCMIGSGAGFDMRMQYEAARYMEEVLYNHDALRIQNTWMLRPCKLAAFPWKYAVCPDGSNINCPGPCCHEAEIEAFHAGRAQVAPLPNLWECADLSEVVDMFDVDRTEPPIVHSINGNLKRAELYTSPTDTRPSVALFYALVSDSFRCPKQPVNPQDPTGDNNKRLYFWQGRVYIALRRYYVRITTATGERERIDLHGENDDHQDNRYVQLDSVHFQGGGCKDQMLYVWAAVQRSIQLAKSGSNSIIGFHCEGQGYTLADYEECLKNGGPHQILWFPPWVRGHRPASTSGPHKLLPGHGSSATMPVPGNSPTTVTIDKKANTLPTASTTVSRWPVPTLH
jgi:hypothetical protein